MPRHGSVYCVDPGLRSGRIGLRSRLRVTKVRVSAHTKSGIVEVRVSAHTRWYIYIMYIRVHVSVHTRDVVTDEKEEHRLEYKQRQWSVSSATKSKAHRYTGCILCHHIVFSCKGNHGQIVTT